MYIYASWETAFRSSYNGAKFSFPCLFSIPLLFCYQNLIKKRNPFVKLINNNERRSLIFMFEMARTFFFNIVTYDEQIFSPFKSIVRIFYYNVCSHSCSWSVKIGQFESWNLLYKVIKINLQVEILFRN